MLMPLVRESPASAFWYSIAACVDVPKTPTIAMPAAPIVFFMEATDDLTLFIAFVIDDLTPFIPLRALCCTFCIASRICCAIPAALDFIAAVLLDSACCAVLIPDTKASGDAVIFTSI